MDQRAEPAVRLAMSRQVDGDDAETGLDERLDELRHLTGMAAPAMDQQHGLALAPAIGGDGLPRESWRVGPVEHGALRRRYSGDAAAEEEQPSQSRRPASGKSGSTSWKGRRMKAGIGIK